MTIQPPATFHLPARALGHVHRWCQAHINGFLFDIEEIDEIVTDEDGSMFGVIGSWIIALKVEIASEADAALFKLKWHDHLIKHPIIPRHRGVAA